MQPHTVDIATNENQPRRGSERCHHTVNRLTQVLNYFDS